MPLTSLLTGLPFLSIAVCPPVEYFYNTDLTYRSPALALAIQGPQDKVCTLQPGPESQSKCLRPGSQEADSEVETSMQDVCWGAPGN